MDERREVGPARTLRRNASGHLTPEEREELAHEAVMLRSDGASYRKIAKHLGISKDTVGKLLREEYDRRRAGRDEARATAIARYESIVRECSRRVKAFADNSSAQNVSGLMAQKRSAQERIDKITGIEAPIKSEHKTTRIDVSKMPDRDLAEFVAIVERNPDVFDGLMRPAEPWEEPW